MTLHTSQHKRALLATSALTAVSLALAAPLHDAKAAEAGAIDEVVVLGEFIPDEMRQTSQVSSIMIPEDLARQGDSNVAAALVRVTGISLVDGRFIYVRGLGERYSSALLNGSPLPSPEPLQRVVPLDLFPSNIIAGVTVQKTYSPDYPGEFGGGTVDIQTIGVPDVGFLSASVSGGFTVGTTFDPGLTYFGSRTDWTSFDNGTRDMPELVREAIALDRGRISQGNFTDGELQAIGQDFVNAPLNLLQRTDTIPGDWSVSLSAGESYDVGGAQLGLVGVVGYSNAWETRDGIQEDADVGQEGEVILLNHYDFMSTQNDLRLNGLVGVGLNWGNYELRWTNFYVRSVTKEARSRLGFEGSENNIYREDFTEWFERQLFDTQGSAYAVFGNLEVELKGSFAKSRREAPYEKMIRYRLVNDQFLHSSNSEQNYTRFGEVDDQVVSAGADLDYTTALFGTREAIFSAGYAFYDNDRSAEQREFTFRASNVPLSVDVQALRADFLFSDFYIGPNGLILQETTGSTGAAAYDAKLRTHAGYVQAEIEVLPLVRATAGVRYEDGAQSVTLRDLLGEGVPPSPPEREQDYWLPAGSVTWNFFEDMQVRFGVSRTIARPQFRELAPQPYQDPDTDRNFIGNPYLQDSEILNIDGRYEWYFAANEYVALGGFYKDIDRPIEVIIQEQGSTQSTSFINAPRSQLFGAEIESRAYFQLPLGEGWIGDLIFFGAANYTYTKSEVKVEDGDVVFPQPLGGAGASADIYVQDGDKMQGQSDHIVNLQFGFEDMDGLQATLLLNYASERISARGRPGFPDLIVEPGISLDFTLRKAFSDGWGDGFEIGFEARNLLGTGFEESQSQGGNTVYNNKYDVGQSFSISLKKSY
jgi:outer membrane receptor protein involved in Fe transport